MSTETREESIERARDRLRQTRAEVVASTKAKQVPWSNSSLLGEVYLAAK